MEGPNSSTDLCKSQKFGLSFNLAGSEAHPFPRGDCILHKPYPELEFAQGLNSQILVNSPN